MVDTVNGRADMAERHTIESLVGPLSVRVVGDGPAAVLWPSLFMDERSWERLVPP